MKRFSIAVLALSALTTITLAGAGAALPQVGISQADAERDFVFSVSVGQFGFDDAVKKRMKAASPEARVAMVEQGLAWMKAFAATPQFEKAYQAFRNDYKPEEPGTEGSAEDLEYARNYYNEQLAEWKANYPATSKEMLRRRLREFLEVSRDVDYDAQLVRKGRKMVFVNEDYESQSEEWKRCFRAGKAPVEKARAIAKSWLAELEAKK